MYLRSSSDHRPLLAKWKEEPPDTRTYHHRRPRRFEEVWTKYEECKEIVMQVWAGTNRGAGRSLAEKMESCLSQLYQWSRRKYN